MAGLRRVIRFGYVPFQLLIVNGTALWILAGGGDRLWLCALFGAALVVSFAAERILPWEPVWNRSHEDAGRDIAHAVVNETLNLASIAAIPLLAAWGLGWHAWPHAWPFALQVVVAIAVLDCGVTLCHAASHRWAWLWRFHAVHHSVMRMYGFNGLMKHPVHQAIEMGAGTLPLVALGMPLDVGIALGFCTAVQLLVQHANIDFRVGPLRGWLAAAEIHRLHHRKQAIVGDVNFGLFTTLWDRVLGTYRDCTGERPVRAGAIGIGAEPEYPIGYLAQLRKPFVRTASR